MNGSDRYVTLNLHYPDVVLRNSKVVPLGLIRLEERATAENLQDLITSRLGEVGISVTDLAAAATDGASNVSKAVQLMGLRKQTCFTHGLDLVVRKVTYGRKALAFDVNVLSAFSKEIDEEADSEPEDGDGVECEVQSVALGDAVQRIRNICRDFKKKPGLMDELRNVTQKPEYNGKRLKVILDCKTRWYSTFLMIERCLRILPALNNVLSRHSTPISAIDTEALRSIARVLESFKRAILTLCKTEATLRHADKVFLLLLRSLQNENSPLAEMLYARLQTEIVKRRTVLSTVLAVLDNPKYDFELERELGVELTSDEEIVAVLVEISDVSLSSEDISSASGEADESPVSFALLCP